MGGETFRPFSQPDAPAAVRHRDPYDRQRGPARSCDLAKGLADKQAKPSLEIVMIAMSFR